MCGGRFRFRSELGWIFPRYFTAQLGRARPLTTTSHWELRTATIGNDKGAVIFEQRDVEVPVDWSQTATNIVVSKYFYGKDGLAASAKPAFASWLPACATPSPAGAPSSATSRRPKTPRTSATSSPT